MAGPIRWSITSVDNSASETDLLAKAVSGDQASLERLLLVDYDMLRHRISRKIPTTMRAAISDEDILQQTFVEVFQRIGAFEPTSEGSFVGWVATIAEHRLLDAVRAHRAAKRGGGRAAAEQRAVHDASALYLIDLCAGPEHTPSRSAARHEAAGAVHVGLAALGEDHRKVLQLRYIDGLAVAEVAGIMQRTPHAIHNLCHRALKELRGVMGRSTQFFSKK